MFRRYCAEKEKRTCLSADSLHCGTGFHVNEKIEGAYRFPCRSWTIRKIGSSGNLADA
jgi:hypothetical protein